MLTDTEIRTLEKKLDDPSHPGYERFLEVIVPRDSFEQRAAQEYDGARGVDNDWDGLS